MLIRRSAGSFKCHFRIFGILGNYFIKVGAILWYYGENIHLDFCYQLELGAHLFMRDRSYQWLKDATSFGLISDKSAEIQGSEYWKNYQFSILAAWSFYMFAHMQMRLWCHFQSENSVSWHYGELPNFQIF